MDKFRLRNNPVCEAKQLNSDNVNEVIDFVQTHGDIARSASPTVQITTELGIFSMYPGDWIVWDGRKIDSFTDNEFHTLFEKI